MKKTHIPKLDDFLGGGIPSGSSIIFCAVPGVECEAFGYQILNGIIEDGNKGFIYTNVAEPHNIIYEFSRYGWNLEQYIEEEKAFFVDGSSQFLGVPPMGKYSIDELSHIEGVVLKAIEDVPDGVGVINNLSTLIDYLEEDKVLEIMGKWNERAKQKDVILVYIFTKWDYNPKFIDSIKNSVDSVVSLKSIEERVIIGQGFMVTTASWTKPQHNMVLFFVLQPGGVKIYIPKILVTGPYNAGKSSFVKAVSKESVSVDRMALEKFPTTIAMDIGHIDHNGFIADVFGTPGQERFDLMLDVLAKESVGAFILVDSTAPQTFARAKEMINKTQAEAIPKVIVANKQDLPDAMEPEKIREAMKLDKSIPIIPTAVKMNKGVEESLDTLLNLLYGDQ
ncbi:ATPase domain-containing protein [Methanobacterium spitsbergense]|uniref:GTP-binding protein n=1 Tax=Methanobacterium spitsbergense TaxID=2874285 RepID=A0A8T5ULM7_9EURY|nr:ATPase domain-containing protein [Methanobacterium spitsbergense]MBZ2164584.1 GTP-binding protein [Methanobacterium spitsbergense]